MDWISPLLEHGLSGIVIVGLVCAVRSLYEKIDKIQDSYHQELLNVVTEYHKALHNVSELIEAYKRASDQYNPLFMLRRPSNPDVKGG